MSTVRVHVADRPGSPAVTEQDQKLVDALWVADVETIQIRLAQRFDYERLTPRTAIRVSIHMLITS